MSLLHCAVESILVRVAASIAICLCAASGTAAADYPLKPVRIIVPTVAGGGLDTLTRMVAEKLNEKTGVPFVIDNRPGAGGKIGVEAGARATADGYTLVAISGTHAATSTLPGNRGYELLRDFVPIIWSTSQPYVLMLNPQVPAKSVPELVALTKANPDAVSYGSTGPGSMQHLAGVLLASLSGARLFHVPYKGGAQVINDVIGGQIQMSFTNYLVGRAHIESGRLRALAVTSAQRSPALPDVPAVAESVPGYEVDNWYGLVAPAKTPASVLDLLHDEIAAILRDKDIEQRLAADASQVVAASRQEFARHLAREVAKWGIVIRQAGIGAQ